MKKMRKKMKKQKKAIERRVNAFMLGITYKEYKRLIKKFRTIPSFQKKG